MSTAPPPGWTQALDLQKHFNDILFRIRSLAFAFGGAAAGVMFTRVSEPKSLADVRWLGLSAPWIALYVVDRLYYHELLQAAVRFAEAIEERGEAPAICTALTAANRRTLHGRVKVSFFYWFPLAGLTFAAVGSGWRPWVLTALPFLAVEVLAAGAKWLRASR